MNLRSRQAGFTLLEILVVLAIIALVAAVATPALRRPSDMMRLEATARELSAALRLTRSRAIARNREQDFTIDVQRKTYSAPSLAPTALPEGIGVNLVVADSQRDGAVAGSIRFYPTGGSSGGEIALEIGGRGAKINVNWLTGAAEIIR